MPDTNLPTGLFTAEQVRALDRCAIEQHGLPGFTLMRRAGKAAMSCLLACWPEPGQITVFCGAGNNAGDGYVLAVLARQQGLPVTVIQVGDADKMTGAARQARLLALQDGVPVVGLDQFTTDAGGVLVDALLGTGLSGELRGPFAEAVARINQSGLPVLALDIPTGLCADTGRVLGTAVQADATVSFIGLKRGLLTAAGPACCGRLSYADLGVPDAVLDSQQPAVQRLVLAELVERLLPRRSRVAHKGDFGHVLVAGGAAGMHGAASLASQAAARVGAGLVSCATLPAHVPALVARSPEVMAHGVISGQEIEPLLQRPTVLVVGPGLGQGPWGEQLLQKCWQSGQPLVADADALNLIAAGRVVQAAQRPDWVLTPHPGEAGRLLGITTAAVQSDRFAAVRALQQRYGGVVVLKGAGTLISDGETCWLCDLGNPGMASGGMGDVLSGVIAGLLAQGLSPLDAARLGVCLHGAAADRAAQGGERGLVASDLLPFLRELVNSATS